VVAREIDPGDLSIHRSIKPPTTVEGVDTAVYAYPAAEYSVRHNGDGYWEVFHDGAVELEESDGRDVLRNIEELQFSDRCVPLDAALQTLAAGVFVDIETLPDSCGTHGSIVLSTDDP